MIIYALDNYKRRKETETDRERESHTESTIKRWTIISTGIIAITYYSKNKLNKI